MKKKVIGLTIAGVVAVSGVVSAASMWGTYKGNDIIRLTINGKPAYIDDVPAINYNNRTMIPVSMLLQAGVNYTWDNKNKTVDIKGYSYKDFDNKVDRGEILAYFQEAHMFEEVEDVAQKIDDLFWTYSNTVNLIHDNKSADMNKLYNELVATINAYNSVLNKANNEILSIKSYDPTVDTKVNALLNTMYTELEYYNAAYDGLENYSKAKNTADWDAYYSNITKAISTSAVFGANKLANETYNVGISK